MINTSHSQPNPSKDLLSFLQNNLGISESAIKLGLRQSLIEQAPLPIVLWSFGILNITQYQKVLDWESTH